MIGTVFGGIGLFLLGMMLMTEGLKAAAGDALQRALSRLTGGVASAFASGMVTTALVQSSSATVVMTIGFVSAGLLTFTQAVGVVIGANLGTTSTGWIVSLLGFKVSVGVFALPLVGVGAVLRLLGRGRWTAVGTAVAGFGVIFVGIDVLQAGMASLSTSIDLGRFSASDVVGRLLLVGAGVVMTVVMQSSSAAVATTLTALHVGTVDLSQAAFLVIGQNVGTTVTASLAALGASVPARRTAVAHVFFNVVVGGVAFALAPVFLWIAAELAPVAPGTPPNGTVALAAFHTGFNLLGAMMVLPFAARFAAVVARLVPDRRPSITRNLDPSVAALPAVATEAARLTVMKIGATLAGQVRAVVDGRATAPRRGVAEMTAGALAEVRAFLGGVRTPPELVAEHQRHLQVLHAIDHLDRLAESLDEAPDARRLTAIERFLPLAEIGGALDLATAWLSTRDGAPSARIGEASARLADARRSGRLAILEQAARGELESGEALRRVDSMRWLDAALHHLWRCVHHLHGDGSEPPATDVFPDPEGVGSVDVDQ
ncbi:Na/Pi symporter [Gemmatimonadota bacterium Y43]|uniref:Na/Pi cotransporter family protein n=1 Tax=Gaopeijia maritima TaxID=3119007 RepID=UPI00328DB7F9